MSLPRLPFILIVAFGLRLFFAWQYQHGKPQQALGSIPFLYEPGNIAYALATHKGFSSPFRSDTGPTAWMTPVYPLLIAGIFQLFGIYTYHSFVAAICMNIIFSALTCVPLFYLGKMLGGVSVGCLAAWLWAVFPNAVVIPVRDIWDASLSALLAATILWATLKTSASARLRPWVGYGLLWGLTLMTNPTLGLLLPFLLAWMAFRLRFVKNAWVLRPVLALAIAFLICVPWTVRNYLVFHTLIPLRSVMGLQLWMGNNEQSGKIWPGKLHPLSNSAERERYTSMGEIQYMAEKRREALEFIAGHPGLELRLTASRFVATWSGGSEQPIRDFIQTRSLYFRFVLLANLLAAAGTFVGIGILFARRVCGTIPVAVFPIVYPLIAYVSLASPRYRHPIDPILLLLTAVSLERIGEWMKSRYVSRHAGLVVFLFGSTLAIGGPIDSKQTYKTWHDYGGTPDSAQYSALDQINRSNVNRLQVAWLYRTGDGKKYSFNPIVVDGVMYVLARNNSIVALDAASGRQIWIHSTGTETSLITDRGINYWESKDRSDRRLLFAVNNFLQAIDARTGEPILSFGTNGRVDLREGLGRDPTTLALVQSTTPGKVFENLLILGSATNQEYDSAPGDVRAYDTRTGKLVWTFHTIPHAGEFGYDTWPKDAWKTVGGANAWGELSVDEKRGIVYVPTASPKYNFYGADRKGANLFGDCLLALDARTGRRIWHFQMVHHDIWDYDNTTAPKLITVERNGKRVDAVAQASKEGFLWVFDRETGEPLWPIVERPVPKGGAPGEEVWPTQPFPLEPPPFARQSFTVKDLSPFIDDPAERSRFRDEILSARNEGLFTPPGLQNTVEMPGNNGGANWGGAAIDPAHGIFYVVSKDLPAMLKLEPNGTRAASFTGSPEERGQFIYEENCRLCHGADRKGQPPAVPSLDGIGQTLSRAQIKNVVQHGRGPMPAFPKLSDTDLNTLAAYLFNPLRARAATPVSSSGKEDESKLPSRYKTGFGFMFTSTGLPAIAPPWTSLTAYDLNTGKIKWKIPLGEVPELAAKGFTNTGAHFPKVGPVVTAGGLIFTGTHDRMVRALDSETGKVLWEAQVDAALEGMPAVYEVNGREYVVFCAAAQATTYTHSVPGHSASDAAIPGAYIAFALPQAGAQPTAAR
ncbi:MAG: PQQ-binding-like beta-propeller repeat protein [Bryobacteraceae bacterium]